MEAKRPKLRAPPAPLAVDLAALRLGGDRDGTRLWRPASGFASRQAAQQQQQRRQQGERPGESPSADISGGEWKTVVAHGRRGKQQLERKAGSFVSTGRGPPPSPQLRTSASCDSTDARRSQSRKKQEVMAGVPPPAFLGEVMFARRSSLQRLVDKLPADNGAGKTSNSSASKQRKQAEAGGTSDSGSGPATPRNQQRRREQRRSRHNELVNEAGENTVASPSHRSNNSTADEAAPTPTASKKCGDKRDFFFRNLEYEVRSQLQVDDVAEYSVTDYEMAAKISRIVMRLFGFAAPEKTSSRKGSDGDADQEVQASPPPPPLPPNPPPKCPIVVTDGTACVGGNVLSFCDHFAHVNAVECDATRIAMLRHNLTVLRKDNATCLHASYLDVMLSLSQDVVFLDPPWGGPEYKELSKLDLFLDSVPLYDICSRLHGHAKCVVLKVPGNFDCEKFALHVPGIVEVHRDLKKMHLVVLDFREPTEIS